MERYTLFSNGTEYMDWGSRNCDRCVKAVFYDEKKDYMPKYRCAIQEHIDAALVDDGCGNKRDYEATHSKVCPHLQIERKVVVKKFKRDERQLVLFS